MKILRPYSHKTVDLGILQTSVGLLRSTISLEEGRWGIVLECLFSWGNVDWFKDAAMYILSNE